MAATDSPPRPTDEESFRRALVTLLVRAAENGVEVSNRSWKCVAEKPGHAWDVQIASMVDSRTEAGTKES